MIRDLVDDGWSLVIYPEGGRSPDGWGQPFKGGAAYLAGRTGAPVVPVFIDGTGSIFGKGMKRPKPGRTRVVFGVPMRPAEGESTRRFNARIEAAVATLADESLTDFWTARQRAAAGTSPILTGPEHTSWRRQWDLSTQRTHGIAGWRRRPTRRWPDSRPRRSKLAVRCSLRLAPPVAGPHAGTMLDRTEGGHDPSAGASSS